MFTIDKCGGAKNSCGRQEFHAQIEVVLPSQQLCSLIEPHCSKAGAEGRRPRHPFETLLRIYFLQ